MPHSRFAMRARATASSTWEEGDAPEGPETGEVVYADAAHVLCRRWNWRRMPLTDHPQTARAVVTVQASGRRGRVGGCGRPD